MLFEGESEGGRDATAYLEKKIYGMIKKKGEAFCN